MKSDSRVKAGVASVIPKDVSSSVAVMVGTITCWNGRKTAFWRVFGSKAPYLIFPWCGLSCNDTSGKDVMQVVFEIQNHRVFFEKRHANEDIAHGWQYNEGFSSKVLPARKNLSWTCFLMGKMLPLAIWILFSGAGIPCRGAEG